MVKFARCILLSVLINDIDARITRPSAEEIDHYCECIGAKYPLLANVWGALDGLKSIIEDPTGDVYQHPFYNGWTHGH